jgi:hypothetical protein
MTEPIVEGWLSTGEAEKLTGYKRPYLRMLARLGRVRARKIVRDWLIERESLLAHKQEMDALGDQRFNPWREDLAEQKRGRHKT